MAYVGILAETDQLTLKDGQKTFGAFAEHLKQEHLKAVALHRKAVFCKIHIPCKGAGEVHYSYFNSHHVHSFGKQRLVINYRQANLYDTPTFFTSATA